LVGWDAIHDGFSPVCVLLLNVKVAASESNRYVAMKVEKPPAKIVKLTMLRRSKRIIRQEEERREKKGAWRKKVKGKNGVNTKSRSLYIPFLP